MSFLWRRSGDPAIEPAGDGTDTTATCSKVTVAVTDEEKWKEFLARMRPEIKPTDADFISKKVEFDKEISTASGLSVDQVLRKHFSRYEVRKLHELADKKREPHLHAQQKQDAAAYKALLQSPTWKSEEGSSFPLSTKLTMAYFGFPVEPLIMEDLFPGLNPAFSSSTDDHDVASENRGMFVPADKRPLRFLNNYDRRGWGKDNSHSEYSGYSVAAWFLKTAQLTQTLVLPNQTFEGYYRLPSLPHSSSQQQPQHHHGRTHGNVQALNQYVPSFRGGGFSSGDEETGGDDDEDIEDNASIASDASMEDMQSGNIANIHDNDLSLRGGSGPTNNAPELEFLYGFSGRHVWQVNLATSLFDTIDALLAIQARQNLNGTGIPLTVAFLVVNGEDAGERFGQCRRIVRGQIGESAQQEQDFYNQVLRARAEQMSTLNDSVSRVVLFVCFQYLDKPFSAGIGKRVAFRPCLDSDTCLQFAVDQADPNEEYPAAYLWKPANVNDNTASNHYEEWFAAVWRALSHGEIDANNNGNLGKTKAHPPRYSYRLTIAGVQWHSQMPLLRESWYLLMDQFNTGNKGVVIARAPADDCATCSVPGFGQMGYGLCPDGVFGLAFQSVLVDDRGTVAQVDVKPWNVAFDASTSGCASFKCQNGAVVKEGEQYLGNSRQLEALLNQGGALIVQPRWVQYIAFIADSQGNQLAALYLELHDLKDDWPQALDMIKNEYVKANQWQDNSVICINQGNPRVYDKVVNSLLDPQKAVEWILRNRTSHDFEPVDSFEMRRSWRQFVHLVSFNRLEIYLKLKLDQNGGPGTGDPLKLKRLDPVGYPWGYNELRYAKVSQPAATGAEDVDMMHDTLPEPAYETQREAETRATGFDPPEIDPTELGNIGSSRVPFLRDLLPTRLPLDSAQRGKAFREWSYGFPLSVNMSKEHPEIPINAPPLEQLFKQRGPDGLASTSLPVMSTQILTPTEQRRLQESFFQMRSIALNRGQNCPHKGCRAYFPVDPDNMARFHAHLEEKHVGTHCPFCSNTLFAHMPYEDKQKHFVTHHSEYFTRKGDLLKEVRLAETIKSKGLVHRREHQYSFCPRCGRNHNALNSKADRTRHDNVCFPGNNTRDANMTYCTFCGDPELTGSGAPSDSWLAHVCKVARGPGEQPASDTFCRTCALPCSKLGIAYARRHLLNCKTPGTARDNWCPWCGIDLKSGPSKQRLQHLEDCGLKPFTGENPVCTETGKPKDSPLDNPEVLRRSLFKPTPGPGYNRVVVPKVCPIAGCQKDLSVLNVRGLYKHFLKRHFDETNNMRHCPFCQVDFVTRKWTLCGEKEAHFQDHIDERYERIIADKLISKSNDWNSQAVQDAFVKRDQNFLDPVKRMQKMQEETVLLTEETLRLTRENQNLRQAAKGGGTGSPVVGNKQQQQTQEQTQEQQSQKQTSVAASSKPVITKPAPKTHAKPTTETPVKPATKTAQTSTGSSQTQKTEASRPSAPTPTTGGSPQSNTPARDSDDTLPLDAVSDDDDDYTPVSKSSKTGHKSNRNINSTSTSDGPYKPGLAPDDDDDDDDDYQEGLVPEPKPDLSIAMQVEPPTTGPGQISKNSGQHQPPKTDGRSAKRQRTSTGTSAAGSTRSTRTSPVRQGAGSGSGTGTGSPSKGTVAGKGGNATNTTPSKKSPLGQVMHVDEEDF